MSNVVSKKQVGFKKLKLIICNYQLFQQLSIIEKTCSETSITVNLPRLNDRTIISLGTIVTVMLIQQYNQYSYARDRWKRESIINLNQYWLHKCTSSVYLPHHLSLQIQLLAMLIVTDKVWPDTATQSSVYSIRKHVHLCTLHFVRTQGTNVHNNERVYV